MGTSIVARVPRGVLGRTAPHERASRLPHGQQGLELVSRLTAGADHADGVDVSPGKKVRGQSTGRARAQFSEKAVVEEDRVQEAGGRVEHQNDATRHGQAADLAFSENPDGHFFQGCFVTRSTGTPFI